MAGPPPGAVVWRDLGILTALYHRLSGTTHLLASPAPEILRALAAAPMREADLLAVLARDYDLEDPDPAALAARVAELVEAGLVTRS